MNDTTSYDIIVFLGMLDFPQLSLISATTTTARFPTLVPQMNICNDMESWFDLLIPIWFPGLWEANPSPPARDIVEQFRNTF